MRSVVAGLDWPAEVQRYVFDIERHGPYLRLGDGDFADFDGIQTCCHGGVEELFRTRRRRIDGARYGRSGMLGAIQTTTSYLKRFKGL